MNANEAKTISIETILLKFGISPVKEKRQGEELWYCSPFREEKTPSFKVSVSKNLFYDFGEGKGGNALDLTIMLLNTDVSGALRWLEVMSDMSSFKKLESMERHVANPENPLQLIKAKPCDNKACIEYIQSRSIDLEIAKAYVEDVYYQDTRTGKSFFGIGFKNLSGGYAVRNKYYKSLVGKSDISFLKGNLKDKRIEVFEGFHDLLSHRCMFKFIPHGDAIVLNSTSLVIKAIELINSLDYVEITLWQDNDQAGKKLLATFEEEFESIAYVRSQTHLYEGYNDVNEYWNALCTNSEQLI